MGIGTKEKEKAEEEEPKPVGEITHIYDVEMNFLDDMIGVHYENGTDTGFYIVSERKGKVYSPELIFVGTRLTQRIMNRLRERREIK